MAGEVDNETIEASNIHLYPDMTSKYILNQSTVFNNNSFPSDQMISLKLYESITYSFISFGKEVLSMLGQSTSLVDLPVVVSCIDL